jgi:hypothetical protein
MRPRKNSILTMLLGLLLVASAAGMAQTPTQGDQKAKTETCCSMDSCCCNNDSCPMKEDGATTTDAKDGCCGDSCKMKEDGKDHADHPGCCGDSCNMKHDAKNHDAKKHDGKHDCCNIKNKSKTKQKAA